MDFFDISISAEAYLIILVIGTITFFLLRGIFRRTIKNDKLRRRLTWVGTIILTPVIYAVLVLAMLGIMFYEHQQDFNREKWFAERDKRYEMRDDLAGGDLLVNKTKNEIIELLGPPDVGVDTMDIWDYNLGISTAGFGWQFNSLILTFANERVIRVEKNEIVD
jgi:hypothetical protein